MFDNQQRLLQRVRLEDLIPFGRTSDTHVRPRNLFNILNTTWNISPSTHTTMPPKNNAKRRGIDIELHRPAKQATPTTQSRHHTHYEPGRQPEHTVTSFPIVPEGSDDSFLPTTDRENDDVPDLLPADYDSDNEEEDLGLQALGLGDSPLVPTIVTKKPRSQAVS